MTSQSPRRTAPAIGLTCRLAVASRVLAAIIGSFLLTSAIQLLLILLLPFSQEPPFPQSTQAADLLGYGIQVGIVLWVFHVPDLKRAWLWPLAWTVVCYALAALLMALPLTPAGGPTVAIDPIRPRESVGPIEAIESAPGRASGAPVNPGGAA